MEQAQRQMPKYISHKQVWALKISDIEFNEDGTAILAFKDVGYANIIVDAEYVSKRLPAARDILAFDDTGYYVVYPDGYKSWSPTKVFEKGYKKL